MDGRLLPTIERQIPLAVKYETSPLWGPAKGLLGLGRTAAAIGCALCDAYSIGPGFVSYSRSKTYYGLRTNHPLISYDRVMTSVEQLLARDCIEDFRQVPGGRGWQSSMVAKPEFVFLMRGLMGTEKLPLWVPPCPVILRDENGCPVPLSASREISR